MKAIVCSPRGFCAGVERAIEVVERALAKFGAPVYVRHEIVHNRVVVEDLVVRGAVFVEELSQVPTGAPVVFSAHGVEPKVYEEASTLALPQIDATCPLVTKVHVEARSFAKRGFTILLIGHREHVEVVGVVGEAPDQTLVIADAEEAEKVEVEDPEKVAVLTQTTLSLDEAQAVMAVLLRRFPKLEAPRSSDICYATTNRQSAVKGRLGDVDLWLVLGDPTSSNSNRLAEIGASRGAPSYLILGSEEIDPAWLENVETIGITSGASTPEISVQSVLDHLRALGAEVEELGGVEEVLEFQLPREVQ